MKKDENLNTGRALYSPSYENSWKARPWVRFPLGIKTMHMFSTVGRLLEFYDSPREKTAIYRK